MARALQVLGMAAVAAAIITAWIVFDGLRNDFHDASTVSSDSYELEVRNDGNHVVGDEIAVPIQIELGRYGRVLSVQPRWPRSLDRRRCFVPGRVGFELSLEDEHRLRLSIEVERRAAGRPWVAKAMHGEQPLRVTQVLQPTVGGDGTAADPSSGCPGWHVRLPLDTVVRGNLGYTFGGSGADALDSPAWKAHTEALATHREAVDVAP